MRKKKYYTINLCEGVVNEYSSMEEAQIKEQYVHPNDFYPNKKIAYQQILKFTQEDLEYSQHVLKTTQNDIRSAKRIIAEVSKKIGVKNN